MSKEISLGLGNMLISEQSELNLNDFFSDSESDTSDMSYLSEVSLLSDMSDLEGGKGGRRKRGKPSKKTKKPTNVSAKKVSSDKIAGIPNEVIIGLAVAFVLVGGFLLINKK